METSSWKTQRGTHECVRTTNTATGQDAAFQTFCIECCFSAVLPARFSDDHLCSYFMEGLPEFRVLQSHPDVALEIGVGASSHGGGRRAAEVGLQV